MNSRYSATAGINYRSMEISSWLLRWLPRTNTQIMSE